MAKQCGQCGRENTATAAFCTGCRYRLAADGPQITDGNRWARNPGEFAVLIQSADLNALLTKGLVVEEGTAGMLFQDGRFTGQLNPGRHTVQSVKDRLKNLVWKSPVQAVLIDIGDVVLGFASDTLMSRDGQNIGFELTLAVQMASPNEFYVNFMKGGRVVLADHLRSRLEPLLAGAISTIVRDTNAAELTVPQANLKEQFKQAIVQSIDEVLGSLGLNLERIEQLSFSNELLDATHQERAERARELERVRQEQEYDAQKLKLNARWNRFIEDMESAGTHRQMEKIESDAQLAQFRSEIDQKLKEFHAGIELEGRISELNRTRRWEDQWSQYSDWKEDRELHREYMLATLRFERDGELAELAHAASLRTLQSAHELDDMQRAHAQKVADEEFERELARQQKALDAELERLEKQRVAENGKKQDDRDNAIADAETNVATQDIEFEQDMKEAEAAIKLKSQYDEGKLKKRAEQQKLENQKRDADHRREQEQRDAEHRRAEAAKDGDSRRHLDELKQFGEMSCDALIAAAPSDRAAMLLDLRKSEALQNLSEDQILAMAAEKSPAVAEALAQKFRSAAEADTGVRQRENELVDRMLREKDVSTAQLQDAHRQSNALMQQLITSVLGSQRDVGIAASTGVPPGYPPHAAGDGHPVYAGQAEPDSPTAELEPNVKCSSCGVVSAADSQYCGGCGRRFSPPGKARVGF
ncbi:MAG: hypothetical protein HQ518_07785 [Rhodopirellula sp.]|nr:hypothetical protein [Rhodopirellula sp.]